MLVSYQNHRPDYIEWKERKDRLVTTEEISIQCDFDNATKSIRPSAHQSLTTNNNFHKS